jgi:hypothetical protein
MGELLPPTSVALQVTVVVPSGKVEPEDGAQVMLATPQLSVAVGGVKLTAPVVPGMTPT